MPDGGGPRDPVQILFVASLQRDNVPWIYELALEAYRLVRSGRREEGQKAIRRFIDAFEILWRGPFAEEFGIDRMALKMIRSEFFESGFMGDVEAEVGPGPGNGKRVPPERKE